MQSRLHHRPRGRCPGTGGRPPPPRRDRERHTGPEVRRRAQPSPLGPLPRQCRLAGRAGDGPQPGPLDRTHRPGRAVGNHQDPAEALLFLGRTPHPQGPPPHSASATGPSPGRTSSVAPWRNCAPCHYPPDRPTASTRPPDHLTASQICVRAVPACPLLQSAR